MNPILLIVVYLVCLVLVIRLIYNSQRRWVSFGYAVLGFGLVAVLGIVATFLLVPARGTVMETNSVLDMVGTAISLAAPIAAVWGASIPPSRGKT